MTRLTVPEILKQVRRIQIAANRQITGLMAGSYQSAFRGTGMDFEEVREYQPGDDLRSIDWNVTARAGRPFVKRYTEERELTVLFLVDLSASGVFGSAQRSKLDLLVEVAAVLMFTALKNGDKVGLILYGGRVLRYFPPRKSKGAVLRCLRELVSAEPAPGRAELSAAAQFLGRVQKRRAVVFLASDFLDPFDAQTLAAVRFRHDLIALTVSDPREEELPAVGLVRLRDAETGEIVEIDASSPLLRQEYRRRAGERRARLARELRQGGLDQLGLSTAQPYLHALIRFFERRQLRGH